MRGGRALAAGFLAASVGCAPVRLLPPPPQVGPPRPSVVQGPFSPPVIVSNQLGSRRGLTIRPPARVGDAMPLLVFLHADGRDHTDFVDDRRLQDLADAHGLMLVSVQSPGLGDRGCWWTPFARDQALYLETVIEAVAAAWPVDRNRVVLVGEGGGAILASGFPAHVDARFRGGVVAVCGGDVPREADRCAAGGLRDDPPAVAEPGAFDGWSLYAVTARRADRRREHVAAAALWRERGRPVALYEAGRCPRDPAGWIRRGVAWTLGL